MNLPPSAGRYPLWGMLSALAGFFALQALAYHYAGVFEYPLDDVYIHLALAKTITQGTYGVNAGEAASASSSILYPFLLLPFPGTELQRLLPLFWNVLAVAACGWVWGRIVAESRLRGIFAVALAVAAPVLLNMSGLGFTGMEASLHMLASLLIVLGLWRALEGQGVAGWFVAAAIAAPLLRYEGLALALGSAGVLAIAGERRAALWIAVCVIATVGAFGLFLMSLGLPPLPGSVLAKSTSPGLEDGFLTARVVRLLASLTKPAAQIIAGLSVATGFAFLAFPALRRPPVVWLLALVTLSALGHLLFGQIGWLHRYEPYILSAQVAALLLVAPKTDGLMWPLRGAAVLVTALAGFAYMPSLWGSYSGNPRAIHLQHAQMARLVREYLKVPVAVNDLGRVAWESPHYVLDIWGLGSDEARRIRLGEPPPPPGWAGPLAAKHGVKAAMIYDKWLSKAVGPDWVRVAYLSIPERKGTIGDWEVAIYATDPAYAPELRARLAEFAPTLPTEAVLTMTGGT